MCYIRRPAGDVTSKRAELSAEQWVSLAEQAVEHGMLFLLLTGGEVFLRRDFLSVYEPLTSMGLSLIVYSNGTLVTPQLAQAMGRRPPSRMEITLYGASPETYGRVTGSADAFQRAICGVDMLRDAGVATALKFTITRSNLHEREAVREIAHTRGLPLKTSWLLTSRVDGLPSEVASERLSAEEVIDLEEADPASREMWSNVSATVVGAECADPMYCLAGKASFAVNPAGEMSPCMDLPFPAARPLDIGFQAAWEEVRAFVKTVGASPVCASCETRAWCPICPARAFVETRSIDGVDAYACAIARARRARFSRALGG